jgi:mono/diheme cytochrome c family protein
VLLVACLALPGAACRGDDPAERATVNPLRPDRHTLAAAGSVYREHCQSCHGPSGRGDGRASLYMQVRPGDLSSPQVQGKADAELFTLITRGRRPMPGFRRKLSAAERWQALLWVRALAADPPAAGQP